MEFSEREPLVYQAYKDGPVSFKCPYEGCQRYFGYYYSCKGHIQNHKDLKVEKIHKCPYPECPKIYSTKYGLNIHITSHTGERRCGCLECGASFASWSSLDRHLTAHRDERPYLCPCEGCEKKYKTRGGLKKHMNTAHKPK